MLPSPVATVIFQRIDDGAVLFEPQTEVYFGLNEVGARVWLLLPPATTTVVQLCDRLASEYPDVPAATIRADVEELLAQLQTEGLVSAPIGGQSDGADPR